ncbi:hypothetical protein SY88_08000 [Clostridiales bacterium PH28_bin88]|nr:hypothetical protein SY88_08000 [Clostridiales bacterium PH28_bin88]
MEWLNELFVRNKAIVYFIYGQVFFLLGVAIALQYRSLSKFRLARSLWALAAFGVLHGLSEWAVVFIPLQQAHLGQQWVYALYALERVLTAASFAYLFYFGAKLTVDTLGRYIWLEQLPLLFFLFWVGNLAISRWAFPALDIVTWLATTDVWCRYLLAFPGALLTAYGLHLQRRELRSLQNLRVDHHILGASLAFGMYAFFAGIIVPRTPFFPSTWLNQEALFRLIGVPVPVFRTLSGMAMVYFMLRILEVFNIENTRRVEAVERKQAILDDRERICRDLHDGVIQNIYAVGLVLENCGYLVSENPPHARGQLQVAMDRLNHTIRDIRNYILNLSPASFQETNVNRGLEAILKEFEANSLLVTRLDWEGPQVDMTLAGVAHLYHIIQEGLNNVLKHAGASSVLVRVKAAGRELSLLIKDNGVGFDHGEIARDTTRSGQGLKNMADRARLLRGNLWIHSTRGQGTEILLTIPLSEVTAGGE